MKKVKFPSLITFVIVGFVIVFSSCKKENVTNSPNYVGTWVGTYSSTLLGVTVYYKETRTLTNNTFVDLTQKLDTVSSKWIDFVKMSGSIAISEDTMFFKLTEYGITSFDPQTNKPTGQITIYKENTSGFETLCNTMGQPKYFYFLYSVTGNKMISKIDLNEDGNFTDENEMLELTKQ